MNSTTARPSTGVELEVVLAAAGAVTGSVMILCVAVIISTALCAVKRKNRKTKAQSNEGKLCI